MDVIVVDSAERSAEIGADLVVDTFRGLPEGVIGLATGSSPQLLYRALGARVHAGADFSRPGAFALDEYIGIPVGHPESYHSIIRRSDLDCKRCGGTLAGWRCFPNRGQAHGNRDGESCVT